MQEVDTLFTEQTGLGGKALDLNSGGAQFYSRPGHRPF
jgi:hypothetical protein